jgi:hypothetical protein
MATTFNSKAARRYHKYEPDNPADTLESLYNLAERMRRGPASGFISGPSSGIASPLPRLPLAHFSDGRRVRIYLSNLAAGKVTGIPQNPHIMKGIADLLDASGPQVHQVLRAEKKAEEEAQGKRTITGSKFLFNAARGVYDPYKEQPFNQSPHLENLAQGPTIGDIFAVLDEEDPYFEQDLFDAVKSGDPNALKQFGINEPGSIVPLQGLYEKPSGSADDEDFIVRPGSFVPAEGSRVPCTNEDCSHNFINLLENSNLPKDKFQMDQPFCDSSQTVCSGCGGLPMLKRDKCSTCGRNGILEPSEVKPDTPLYDPRASATNAISNYLSTPGGETYTVGEVDPLHPENFAPTQGNTDITLLWDAMSIQSKKEQAEKARQQRIDSGLFDDQYSQPDEEEEEETSVVTTSPEDQIEAPAKPPIRRRKTKLHSITCSYGCQNGTLAGASTEKARQRVRAIKNSQEYHRDMAEAVDVVKNSRRVHADFLASNIADAIAGVNNLYFACPEANDPSESE